jgi:hypothetical protein
MENPGQFKPEDFLVEAAPGITVHDVEAVRQPKAKRAVAAETTEPKSVWAAKPRIYAKLARGNFRNAKWIVMLVTLGIYYLLPWIRFDRGADLPDQFFLIDSPTSACCSAQSRFGLRNFITSPASSSSRPLASFS